MKEAFDYLREHYEEREAHVLSVVFLRATSAAPASYQLICDSIPDAQGIDDLLRDLHARNLIRYTQRGDVVGWCPTGLLHRIMNTTPIIA